MEITEPKIFHIAETTTDYNGMEKLLNCLGCPNWETDSSNAEELIEVAGKFCYKSFSEDLNPNLSRVRTKDNRGYIGNILKSKHGSVLEHGYDTYAILDVSRVFTHELVRHRLANYSQESLRFVRLDKLKAYYPEAFGRLNLDELYDSHYENQTHGLEIRERQIGDWEITLKEQFREVFEYLETVQKTISEFLHLDKLPGNFAIKKKLTSAMRRMAPIGLATGIIITTNHRNWRHLIEMRTSAHAEEEIRLVFLKIAVDLKNRYKNIYQDMTIRPDGSVVFEYSKV